LSKNSVSQHLKSIRSRGALIGLASDEEECWWLVRMVVDFFF
jgi:hypothetical protein